MLAGLKTNGSGFHAYVLRIKVVKGRPLNTFQQSCDNRGMQFNSNIYTFRVVGSDRKNPPVGCGGVEVEDDNFIGLIVLNFLHNSCMQLQNFELFVPELTDRGIEHILHDFRTPLTIEVPVKKADTILNRPQVAFKPNDAAPETEVRAIQPNPTVAVDLLPEEREQQALDFREGVEWGIAAIGADQVWDMGFTGQGVVIGGQDTGYEWDHPAIKESYRGWDDTLSQADHNYNWHDAIHEIDSMNGPPYIAEANPCGLSSLVPCDDHNHGTHTMGTMTGTVSDEGKSIGVAPGAKWIACRNMERGYGSPASYIECFEWFLAPTDLNGENPDPSKAPHVIANSWSCPEIEGCTPANFETMQIAVDNLKAAGVVVVVSAGNSGSQCHTVSTPAAIFENSFTIGATRQTDTIANFSSRGTVTVDSSNRLKPNIAAPGVGIRSSIRNGGFATFSGTSMAGPHVAGAVALLISANPELAGQVEAIEDLLESTARPMLSDQDCGGVSGMEVPNAVYGYGRMNILAAVQETVSTSSRETLTTALTLQAAPNPAREIVLLTSSIAPKVPATVQWMDARGQLVKTMNWPAQASQLEVDLRHLPKGVYIVQARIGVQLYITRVVKQ